MTVTMTVTINGSGTMTGLAVGGLNDNIITKNEMATGGAWAPAGTVLQVVNALYSTAVASSSSTFTDTGLTATITPTSATSKILVMFTHNGCGKSADTRLQLRLLRGGSVITNTELLGGYNGTPFSQAYGSSSAEYLDSPAATTATTYKTQFASGDNIASVLVQWNGSVSTMILMEIAA